MSDREAGREHGDILFLFLSFSLTHTPLPHLPEYTQSTAHHHGSTLRTMVSKPSFVCFTLKFSSANLGP